MLPLDGEDHRHRLADAGYEAAYIGKWHLASCGPRGRARRFPDEGRAAGAAGRLQGLLAGLRRAGVHLAQLRRAHVRRGRATARLPARAATASTRRPTGRSSTCGTRTGGRPFFLFVSYIEPHHQNDHGHYEGPRGSKERFRDFVVPGDLVGAAGDWREEYPDYLGCIHSLDENLGRIRGALERLGLADNTLIVYTSDHGSHFRTRNAEYKRSCHDGCIRIPLIARGPGFRGGKVVATNWSA